jgi:hypothetical protein
MRTPIATGSDNDLFGWRLGRSDERGSPQRLFQFVLDVARILLGGMVVPLNRIEECDRVLRGFYQSRFLPCALDYSLPM